MLKISTEQYTRINAAFAQHRRVQILRTLRAEGTVDPAVPDGEAIDAIDKAIKEGAELGIDNDELVLRLCRIVFARREHRITDQTAELIGGVLANDTVSASTRLDFIEQQIIQKSISPRLHS